MDRLLASARVNDQTICGEVKRILLIALADVKLTKSKTEQPKGKHESGHRHRATHKQRQLFAKRFGRKRRRERRTEFAMWHLMWIFGEHLHMGMGAQLFEGNVIEIESSQPPLTPPAK